MKRLTYEFVKEGFENEGYELLSTEYINNFQKLKYICPKGHRYSITWNKWQGGRRCPYCYGNGKPTIEFIKSEFKKEGYTLLDKEYKNARTKLRYRCPNGHKHSITWSGWQQGQRCSYCSSKAKLTIEFVKEQFENEGWVLSSKEYVGTYSKLDCICPNGHKHSISWSKWQQGRRCPYCSKYRNRYTIEFIRSDFEKNSYILLTEEYINDKRKLDYICPNGHRHSISWNEWQRGNRCPTCAIINNSGSNHYNWKDYSKEDLEKISVYKSCVWQLTNHNYRKCKNIVNPLDLPRRRKKYSLDHIYSISDGFRNNVPAEILASPINLQILPYYENIVKRTRSDIALNELYTNYSKELDNELQLNS